MTLTTALRTGARSMATKQRRFARIRPDGLMDRMGPETTQVHGQYLVHLLALAGIGYVVAEAVANFEVENPWEHFHTQIPRGVGTGMNS